MSYISLYRKWRSQNFEELVGQEHIIQTLTNAIKLNRLSHAYLFSGPRGTGKTSAARILAKALNCKEGPTATPCGKCDQCSKIRDGYSADVIEIDAASNRGIDEIRDLRERVRYAPIEGRYKVYIIDEAHMLTSEAFNALLKTLEEPPSHVVFVLATTEPQKVPLTISSRCQRLDFHRLPVAQIIEQLKKITKGEGFKTEEKALQLIARNAEGSMRDAISLFDQLVSFCGDKVSADDVVLLLGAADEEFMFSLSDAIAKNNTKQILELVDQTIQKGINISQLTRDLMQHFRHLLLVKSGVNEIIELTVDQINRLKKQTEEFSLDAIKNTLRALSRAELDMKWHPRARLVLEMCLVEMLSSVISLQSRVEKPQTPDPRPETRDLELEVNPLITKIKTHWPQILEKVKSKSVFGFVSLHEGHPLEINAKGKLVIAFKKGFAFHMERLQTQNNKEAVELSIKETVGESIPIECIVSDQMMHKATSVSFDTVKDFFEGKVVS